jgi:hypothetical protein
VTRIYLNDSTLILHVCYYLPFEEDLTLDLYKFEFILPKNDLYQVLLKLSYWFWRRKLLKMFSNINTCKNGFPHCGPTQPPGAMNHDLYKLESALYQEPFE